MPEHVFWFNGYWNILKLSCTVETLKNFDIVTFYMLTYFLLIAKKSKFDNCNVIRKINYSLTLPCLPIIQILTADNELRFQL